MQQPGAKPRGVQPETGRIAAAPTLDAAGFYVRMAFGFCLGWGPRRVPGHLCAWAWMQGGAVVQGQPPAWIPAHPTFNTQDLAKAAAFLARESQLSSQAINIY